jgi:N-acetylmuramoyl-L-alanine amidase
MGNRKFTQGTGKYRYSINAQEKETDLNENITTALYWEYDSRIGRRWNVDPKVKTEESAYLCFSGNPIFYTDNLGDEADADKGKKKKKKAAATTKSTPSTPATPTTTVTDAGHGINGDPGASSGTGCNTGVDPCAKEAELALKIEQATSSWLQKFGVTNTRTRDANIKPGGDQVKYRIKKANAADAEILVSFHLDWEKGRKYVNAVYQQAEGSSKTTVFEDNSKKLAGLIIGELTEMNADNSAKIVPVSGNTRFKTLGVLNGFKGKAATLIEFGSVGDAKTVQLINTNADAIGKQVASGMYLYLYGSKPSETGIAPKWGYLMTGPPSPSVTFPWLFHF